MLYENKLKTAVLAASTSGNNTIISAPTTGFIAIDQISFICEGEVSLTFKSNTTTLSGAMTFGTYQAAVFDNTMQSPDGCITCKPGEAFIINLSNAVGVNGYVRYRIVQ